MEERSNTSEHETFFLLCLSSWLHVQHMGVPTHLESRKHMKSKVGIIFQERSLIRIFETDG